MLQHYLCKLRQGMLAIGAALLGSPCVVGLDVDADALQVAHDNCEQFEDPLPVSYDQLRPSVGFWVANVTCFGGLSDLGVLVQLQARNFLIVCHVRTRCLGEV